jgi:hypothetical protein
MFPEQQLQSAAISIMPATLSVALAAPASFSAPAAPVSEASPDQYRN